MFMCDVMMNQISLKLKTDIQINCINHSEFSGTDVVQCLSIAITTKINRIIMRSKIHLKGHPLHPILVALPIAFFIGTLVFDVLGYFTSNDNYWITGYYLEIAGIASAVLAAIPGIVDYASVVPPNSSAKKRATKHGILNVLLLLIFGFVWFYRRSEDASATTILIGEVIGVILLSFSGWLGGTLVHRNQIGIDHRFANAGKWKEKYFQEDKGRIEVCKSNELSTDQMMLLHVKDKRIVLGKSETGYLAFDDACTHRGASLADGVMICGTVQCPWHGSQFDCKTGMVKAGPAKESIATYKVEDADGKVYLVI
jgi:uncharacterized membrane protein/nitrite reductase/ring-hydroxylating ferredoxin subunit